ncbi:MAG: hypothetical protein HYU64_18260 [Armatimonadetes bacterium]|nr:hypothetical protein [Armatimonadota bacterium]
MQLSMIGKSYTQIGGSGAHSFSRAMESGSFANGLKEKYESSTGRDTCRNAVIAGTATLVGTALGLTALGRYLGMSFGFSGAVAGGIAGLACGLWAGEKLGQKVYESIAGSWASVCLVNLAEEAGH